MVNWERLFDRKDINETILNAFRNYVPNKYITVNDKDSVWMNETMTSKTIAKNKFFKQYIQNGRFESDFLILETLLIELDELISSTKALFYKNLAKKLNNLLLQAKTSWSIIKTFYNDKKSRLFHLFRLTINLLLIFKQRQIFSINSLLNNVHPWKMQTS